MKNFISKTRIIFAILILVSYLGKSQCHADIGTMEVSTNTAPGIKIHLGIMSNFRIGNAVIGFRTDSCKYFASIPPRFYLDSAFIDAGYTTTVNYDCDDSTGFGIIELNKGMDSILPFGQQPFGVIYFPVVTGSQDNTYNFYIVHNQTAITPYSVKCSYNALGSSGFTNEPLPGPSRIISVSPQKFVSKFTVSNMYLKSNLTVRDFSNNIVFQNTNVATSTLDVTTTTWRSGDYFVSIIDEEGNQFKITISKK